MGDLEIICRIFEKQRVYYDQQQWVFYDQKQWVFYDQQQWVYYDQHIWVLPCNIITHFEHGPDILYSLHLKQGQLLQRYKKQFTAK